MTVERPSDDLVVGAQHLHGAGIAELLGEARRSLDVGEEDGPERGLHIGLARWMLDDAAHEALHHPLVDLDDLVRHEPV